MDGKGGDEAANMLKKAETNNEDSPFGEMTQRLVAGLMEENAINPADVEESTKKGSGGDSSDTENVAAKGQLIKSLNITNAENLEARVRKELEEQGILDPNEEMKRINEVRARVNSRDSSPGDPLTRTRSMQPKQDNAGRPKQAVTRTKSSVPRLEHHWSTAAATGQ